MKHLRIVSLLLALACAGDAAAQINERDRLERCANNRARMLEIQAAWPSGPAGWSDEQIARARTGMQGFYRQRQAIEKVANEGRAAGGGGWRAGDRYDLAMEAIVRDMARSAREFDILCYPFGIACYQTFIDEIGRKIDAAEAARPQRAAMLQQFNIYKTNYIALGCVEDAAAQAAATPSSGSATNSAMMTGTFDSSFDVLTLSPGGGSYAYQGGQVQVSSIQGNVMEGIWTQTRSGRQCPDGRYYGRFRFTFSAGGFTGSYGYCDEEPGAGAWNGTRR